MQVPVNFASLADPVEFPAVRMGWQMALFGSNGKLVSGSGPRRGDQVVLTALEGHVVDTTAGGRIVVAVPLSTRERVVGAIRASAPASVVTDRARWTWLVMGLIGLSAVAVAAILGRGLATRLTRPIGRLAAAAHDLGRGDFAIQLHESGVAEVDEVAGALETTARHLGDALERERAFSSEASHQLMTPMTAMRLTLEAAAEDTHGDPRTAISEALGQLDRLESGAEGLLALRRGQLPGPHRVSAAALEAWLLNEWHGRLASGGRPLRITRGPDLVDPGTSFEAARHVLDVLVGNAYVHGAGAVHVDMRNAAGMVAVDVGDEGAGIGSPPDELFRSRGASHDGHGIGLALARSLVEADGGRLTVTRAGPAPVFTVVWPAAAPGDGT
jgi:signal transduction histidine kinase